MSRELGGPGGIYSKKETERIPASFGPHVPAPLDLNKAKPDQLAAHALIGTRLANKLVNFRKKGRIAAPAQLYYAGLIDRRQLRKFEAYTFGDAPIRPRMQRIEIDRPRLHHGEAFALSFAWLVPSGVSPVILSVEVRFPSGRTFKIHIRLSSRHLKAGRLTIPGFSSGESGELYVLATLRDEGGGVSRHSAIFWVFPRNPVQIFVAPEYLTRSGGAGAPKYNFGNDRWYCYAQVRWVNGEARSVNLGRRVDVHVTDAGIGTVANFSFNLSSDIVIPAFSTVYGNWYTWHGSGGIFDEFSAKGDLTFRYSMSGSGFTPARSGMADDADDRVQHHPCRRLHGRGAERV